MRSQPMVASLFKLSSYALFVMILTSSANAQAEAPSTTQPKTAVLWYRSSDGCPDGADFIKRIGERAPLVRLAEAGDRVDFMVTLAVSAAGARGRLERETERGTVAIREIEDETCESVADVAALNLSLALDPDVQAPPVAAQVAPETVASPEAVVRKQTPPADLRETSIPNASEPAPTPPTLLGSPLDQEPTEKRHVIVRVGAQGGILTGVASQVMGRATAFVDLSEIVQWGPLDLSLRAAAVGAWGGSDTTSGTIRQTVWAGRFDLCPLRFGSSILSLRPCAALELGQLRASGPLSDQALWAAVGAHLRGQWLVAGPLAIEAELGANFPLTHYQIAAGSSELYRSAVVGLSTSLGASVAF